jgi:hypothetical protein
MPYQATTPTSDQVGVLHAGSVPLPNQQISFTGSTVSGTTVIAAPPTGWQIAVMQMVIASTAAVTAVKLYSSSTTSISLAITNLVALTPLVLPYSPMPWITCAPGESLVISWTTAATISGSVNYVIVPSPLST